MVSIPNPAEAHNKLGLMLEKQGELEAATAHYEQAIALQPDCAEFHSNLANVLRIQNYGVEAILHYQQALALQPNSAAIHNSLGMVLQEQLWLEEAITHYQQALTLQPSSVEIRHNLARALEAAIAYYQQALLLNPPTPEVHTNLGNALREQGRWEGAIYNYQQALALDPNYYDAHNNLGVVLLEQGQPQAAITHYQQALTLQPNSLCDRYNLSIALLTSGDFQRGFTEYEWRWQKADNPARTFPQALWDGSSLEGKTILLHGEQGLGDQIQFIRYVPLVAQLKGRIVVECAPPLLRLFSTMDGISQIVARGETLPTFDVHAPLMSLPRLLGTTLETVPAQVPYLCKQGVGEGGRAKGAGRKGQGEGDKGSQLKVGIVWAGSPLFKGNYKRFCPLSYFLKLLDIPNITLYSLQTGPQREELTQLPPAPIRNLSNQLSDFADTALMLEQLDLTISVDTAVAHLAGALGKPVWILLSFAPDWRWMLEREDSPWYPTCRLFRQSQPGDWAGVFEQVGQALQSYWTS
ncbi:MAG: glycosyltransferase family protein [Chroococcidiopsidaceae cyanobacterium CP_BM_ER_R8_30]|nr:glycosyltransferase family protein [Chroococcidiopsidaceae cyanobacterium CP_BM_ER_R8_30]